MNLKNNQLIIGAVLIVAAFFVLFDFSGAFNFKSVFFFAAGGAMLCLYRVKNITWALIIGCFLVYVGGMDVFKHFISSFVYSLVGGMIFLAPSAILFIRYYEKNKREALMPACLLLWLGLFIIFNRLPFFFCIGAAFITAYALGKGSVKRIWAYIGALMILFNAVITVLGFGLGLGFRLLFGFTPLFLSVSMIALGGLIILAAFKKR